MKTTRIVEAVLFASESPLSANDIARADDNLSKAQVEAAITELQQEYERDERAFQIYPLADGYQILTRPEYASYLERFDSVSRTQRLSRAALETLAIIAFRQPVSRLDIEEIRGVNAAGVLRTLQERGLIDVVGRAEGLGRPLLYGTTDTLLDHFGFTSLDDLPTPENLQILRDRARENRAQENGGPAAGGGDELAAESPDEEDQGGADD